MPPERGLRRASSSTDTRVNALNFPLRQVTWTSRSRGMAAALGCCGLWRRSRLSRELLVLSQHGILEAERDARAMRTRGVICAYTVKVRSRHGRPRDRDSKKNKASPVFRQCSKTDFQSEKCKQN